jgi:hypothetical protein
MLRPVSGFYFQPAQPNLAQLINVGMAAHHPNERARSSSSSTKKEARFVHQPVDLLDDQPNLTYLSACCC